MLTRNALLEFFPAGDPLAVYSVSDPGEQRAWLRLRGVGDPISAIAAGIGGVGSILGGVLGSNAAGKAAGIQQGNAYNIANQANAQTQYSQAGEGQAAIGANGQIQNGLTNANATLGDVFGQQTANLQPYLQAGQTGVSNLLGAVAPGGALAGTFTAPTAEEAANTPGEQFAFQQGQQALQRSAAATGGLLSGGTLKALDQYSQNLASQYYQQAYNNSANTFSLNRNANLQNIQTLLGTGQQATQQFNTAASNYGNQAGSNIYNAGLQSGNNMFRNAENQSQVAEQNLGISANALTGGANAQAAGVVGSANAWNGAIGGLTNAAQFGAISAGLNGYGYNAPSPVAVSGGGGYSPAPPLFPPTVNTPGILPPNYQGPTANPLSQYMSGYA